MAKVLICDATRDNSLIQNVLKPRHEIQLVYTMSEAAARLRSQQFDLIVIDLHFDESRMFEAMHLVKLFPANAGKPIICVGSRYSKLDDAIKDGLEFAVRAMGAWMLLDLDVYTSSKNHEEEVARLVERCLVGQHRKSTLESRLVLHRHRAEIHELRKKLETEEWSEDVEYRLVELRRNLTTLLLQVCDLNMATLKEQQQIDESREWKDRVVDAVTRTEDKATRQEREQSVAEIEQSVTEFEIGEREHLAKERAKKHPLENTPE